MKPTLLIIFLLSPFFSFSQTVITGSIKDTKGAPLTANITVQAKDGKTISGFGSSKSDGSYSITYRGTADSITLTVSGINIGKHFKTIANKSQTVDFAIENKPIDIKEVSVLAPKIAKYGDTLTYRVDAYTGQDDRVIGDVLKKLPGIEVSPGGQIKYNGRGIIKFYIENMDLLQGRYGIATNNIAAKDVASVQVLENHQPIKALRNRVYSEDAAINLKLKESAKGTWALTGMAGAGYKPAMWNAELVAMRFARKNQNMTAYKSNNSGHDVAGEFRTNYDYERIYLGGGSPLYVQSPQTPPVPRNLYLYNNVHAVTANQLFKLKEDLEFTANALYYNDRIKMEAYSLYEQYLPGDSTLVIEEEVRSLSKIHNAEIALRFNTNAADYYMNNALNLRGNWNHDNGAGVTRSNAGNFGETLSQHLNKPAYAADYTLNLIKNLKKNSFKVYFSAGYAHRPHALTVRPADYFGDEGYDALKQKVLSRDFSSVLRLSYGLKLGKFNLDYNVWGRTDMKNMDTELLAEKNSVTIPPADSLKNNLWYNTWQTGFHQSYSYKGDHFRVSLNLPATYYMLTVDDRIPDTFARHHRMIFNPSFSASYDVTHALQVSASGGFSRSFGDMNSSYTGFVMHGYRSLLRNTVERLFESRSARAGMSFNYRDPFKALFLNGAINYNHAWRNLLYGCNYQGIMSVKTTIDRPTESDSYSVNLGGSKGLDFWSSTLRASASYSTNKGEQLIQDEKLKYRSQSYSAGGSINASPVKYLGMAYNFRWSESKSYVIEKEQRFTPIKSYAQDVKLNVYPMSSLTINISAEHRYNSAAQKRHTAFGNAGVKFKRNKLDLELEVNNLFNTKQYVTAYYSDISSYYYSYDLRPLSVLLKARFKLK